MSYARASLLALAIALWGSRARASDLSTVEGEHTDDLAAPYHALELSASGASLLSFHQGSHAFVGAGLSATVPIVSHQIEFELVAHVMRGEHETVVPIDFLLRHPFILGRVVHPYLGIGPTLIPVVGESGTTTLEWGVASAYGIDFWVTPKFALFFELSMNAIEPVDRAAIETGLALGPVVAF